MAISTILHLQPQNLSTDEGGTAASPARQRWGNARVTDRNKLYLGTSISVLSELQEKVTRLGGDARFLPNDPDFYTPYPQDIMDAAIDGLKITRKPAHPLNKIHDACRRFLSAKFAGNNALDKFKYVKVADNLALGASQSEVYDGFLEKNQIEKCLKSIVSPDQLANFTFTPISCGNMLKLTDQHGNKVLAVGEYSIENEFIIQTLSLEAELIDQRLTEEEAYNELKQDVINFLRYTYKIRKNDKIVLLPQNSYHLDLDICSPRPGYVVVGSYDSVLAADSENLERYQLLAVEKTELIKKSIRMPGAPLNLTDTKKVLAIKQEILDQMALKLEQSDLKVIRVLGNLPLSGITDFISSDVKKSYCKSDYYETFNFLNGVSMKAKDGTYHYFCFGSYEELKSEQLSFKAALTEIGVKCHFIGKNNPYQNHVYLQVDGAGPHCMTSIVSE